MLRLYTDESPGLKVDPVVVLVLSLVFIFSVVALHSESPWCYFGVVPGGRLIWGLRSHCEDYEEVFELDVLRPEVVGQMERGGGGNTKCGELQVECGIRTGKKRSIK
jgi:hypothetical protein